MKVEEIVARIREEIRAREREAPKASRPLRYERGLRRFPTLRYEEDLATVNRSWAYDPVTPIASHRRWVGPLIVSAKSRLQKSVVSMLQGYFDQERVFLQSLVRTLNRLVEHLDHLVNAAHRDDELLVGRTELFLQRAREEEVALEARVEELRESVARLRAGAAPPRPAPPAGPASSAGETTAAPRAGDAEARARFAFYVPALVGFGPVLHVLAGFGDLVARLREAGVDARGIEPDAGAAAAARERGVDVTAGAASLEGVPPGSLGAVVLTDTERLPPGGLATIVAESRERLRPDGIVLVETPNPASFGGLQRLAMAGRPGLARDELGGLVEGAGFVDVHTDLAAHTPAPLELSDLELRSPTLRQTAENFRRLNDLLFAPAWQIAIGRRP